VSSQSARQAAPIDGASADKASIDEQHGSIEEEMRAKRAIKFAEEEHKDTLEKAQEILEVAIKLRDSFENKKFLDRDDNKRLNRLEKLAKQLRGKAGGSDSEITIEKPPANLENAICQVAESSESLSELIKKTPRQVIAAGVIEKANVLLQLIKVVRHFSAK
jgi:hypothetical protein